MANKIVDVTLRFVDNFTKPMQGAIGSLEKHAKQYKRMGREIESTGKSIASVGKSLTTAVTVPVVGLGAAAVKTAADFESGMSKVQSIVGKVSEDSIGGVIASAEKMGLSFEKSTDSTETAMNILAAKAKQMGAQTKFSATESADAFSYMAMAGWKAEDMLEGIEGIMYLAGASGEELGATSDIVTDALTAFGMSASDTNRFVDVLAKTASNANTNVSLMGETFQYVAPVAGALGYNVEDVSVAIGLMANSGIKASSAGTALRSLLTNLAKPTDSVEAAMTKLGISLTDSQGNMKDFSVLMKEMRGSFSNLTEAQKAEYAATLAGKTGMSGLLAIVNSSDSDFDKLTESIQNSNGAAKEMYDVANDNLQGQLTVLKSTLESIAITFGEKLMPYVKKGAEKLQELANKFAGLNDKTMDTIIKIAAVAAAVGPALLVFGKMVIGIGKVISFAGKLGAAISKAGGVMAMITSPAGIVVMVLGAIVVATILVIKNWDKIKMAAQRVFGFVKTILENIGLSFKGFSDKFDGIKSKFSEVGGAVKQLWSTVQPTVTKIGDIFSKVFSVYIKGVLGYAAGFIGSWVNSIMDAVSGVIDVFKGIITFLTGAFTGDWDKALGGLKTAFHGAFDTIGAIALAPIKAIINAYKGAFAGIENGITSLVSGSDGKLTALGEAFARVKDAVGVVVSAVKNVWSQIAPTLNQIKNLFVQIFDVTLGAVLKMARAYFSSWINSIKGYIDGIKTTFKGIVQFVSGIFSGDWKKAWEGIKNIFSGVIKSFASMALAPIKALANTLLAPFGPLADKVKAVTSDMKEKFKSAMQTIGKVVSPVFNAIGLVFTAVFVKGFGAALKGAKSALGSFISSLKEYLGGIKTALSGVLNFLTGIFTGNWSKAWKGVKQIVAGVFTSLKALVLAPMKALASFIGGAMAEIKNVVTKAVGTLASKFVEGIQKMKNSSSPVIKVLGTVFDVVFVKGIGTAVKTARAFFTSWATSIKSVVAGVKQTIGGIVDFISGVFTGNWSKAWSGIKNIFEGVFKTLKTIALAPLKALVSAVSTAMSSLKSVVSSAANALATKFVEGIQKMKNSSSPILRAIGTVVDVVFVKGIGTAVKTAKAYFTSWADSIKTVIAGVKQTFGGIATFISGVFTGNWSKALTGLKNIFSGVFNSLKALALAPLKALASAIKVPFNALVDVIKGAFDKVKEKIASFLTNTDGQMTTLGKIFAGVKTAIGVVVTAFQSVADAVAPIVRGIGSVVSSVFSTGFSTAIGAAKGVLSSFQSSASTIIEGIKGVFNGLVSFITGVFTGNWGKAWEGVKSVFSGAFNALTGLCKAPINAVISLINSAIGGLNKISVSIPDWVPSVGGKTFGVNIPTVPMLYKGTDNWIGGPAMIHDRGAEIVDLPQGTRVIPHDKSLQMAKEQGSKSVSVTIAKIADSIIVREEADIDRIANLLAQKLEDTALNMGVV